MSKHSSAVRRTSCAPDALTGAWMAARVGVVRLEIVPGCGHTPHLERPESYRAIVERFFGVVDSAKEDTRVDSMANGS